jgi:hypothetical protein
LFARTNTIKEFIVMTWKQVSTTIVGAVALGCGFAAHAQQPPAQPDPEGQVAALKQSVQDGLAKVRQYEWVETTIIRLNGEEKGRKQNRCFYGSDGTVQKVSLDQPAQEDSGGRREGRDRTGPVRGRVVENKTDDMKDYMERAAALVHQYVPPNPAQIQAAQAAGRVAVTQPSGSVHVAISEYLQQGDSLTLDMNPTSNALLGLDVNTYLDTPNEPVTLAVTMSTLPDGALYAAETTLDAKAKDITVVIQNSGYKPAAQ